LAKTGTPPTSGKDGYMDQPAPKDHTAHTPPADH
jgi:hypothetical protein